MNLSNDPTTGRILLRGKGTGGLSRADIERRVRELADIDGRSGADITDDDLARANADLLGLRLPPTNVEEAEAHRGLSRDPSEPVSDSGQEIRTHEGPDEEKAVERLAREGVDEAQHEQMIAARRRERQRDEQGGS